MMRYLLIITIIMSLMAMSCGRKAQPAETPSLFEASRQELAAAVEQRDQLLALVKDISVSMDQIKHLENIMTVAGTQTPENPAQRSQLISDMAALKETLQRKRSQLAELEGRLENSALFSEQLKSTIDALRAQIDAQTAEIESLRAQVSVARNAIRSLSDEVDSLNMTVAETTEHLDAARSASARLENELNTCYYVAAPKSQLKRHHIIETGFLRKSKLLSGDFDKGLFVIGDKRNLCKINLVSKKAKIHTNHPADSYEFADSGGRKMLVITDPEKFWSLTNYLVIQTD